MTATISIVDYGMGNIGSLTNMLRRIGAKAEVVSDIKSLTHADKILLPGVGAFDAAMARIHELGFYDVLRTKALDDKTPLMGICLGMQLLTSQSEEGRVTGLGLIPGKARKFPKIDRLKVPHMGWNTVDIKKQTSITEHLPEDPRFYFVHSYYVKANNPADRMLTCQYGLDFDAGIQRDKIYGVQFHPEKSHKFGMALLRGFVDLPC